MPRTPILDLRWSAILGEFRRSGLTHAEFCRRRGLSIHSFRKHLYAHSAPKAESATTHLPADSVVSPFLPVVITPEPTPDSTPAPQLLELILSRRHRIAVAPGFDPHTLRQLIDIVEERL
jgi:hypothetical protein